MNLKIPGIRFNESKRTHFFRLWRRSSLMGSSACTSDVASHTQTSNVHLNHRRWHAYSCNGVCTPAGQISSYYLQNPPVITQNSAWASVGRGSHRSGTHSHFLAAGQAGSDRTTCKKESPLRLLIACAVHTARSKRIRGMMRPAQHGPQTDPHRFTSRNSSQHDRSCYVYINHSFLWVSKQSEHAL